VKRWPGRTLVHLGLVLGGIAAGVALLVAAELTLRLLDVGNRRMFEPATAADGSRIVRLALNPQFDKAVPAAPQREFPAEKSPAGYRIFVIGESSAERVPYGTGLAFSAWLARRLEAQAPDVHWQVVNAALAGAQSWSALTIVRDIARWSPDLLVVYLGHNEVGTRFTAAERRWLDPRRLSIATHLKDTRLYAVLTRALPMLPGRPDLDLRNVHRPGEAFAVIAPGGGRVYATAADRALSSDLYRARLGEMVRIMQSAGARTMLLTLPPRQ
jgi:lysophospholipase L1-like esterase